MVSVSESISFRPIFLGKNALINKILQKFAMNSCVQLVSWQFPAINDLQWWEFAANFAKKKKKPKQNWCCSLLFSSHFHPSVQVATNDKRTCFFFRTARFLTAFLLLYVFFCSGLIAWLGFCLDYREIEASLCVIMSDPWKAIKLY